MPHLFRSCFGCMVIIAFVTVSHTTYTAAAEAQATEVLQRDSVDDLPSQAGSLDIAFVRLNLEIPSFSGMYLDKGGLKVMLQNMSDAEAARPKIVKFLRDNYALEYKEKLPVITFEHAKTELNWLDVYHYKLALRDVLTIQDTVLLDADEVCGCVTVGISNERARPVVENFIKMAGVPTNAVHVQLMPAIMPLQDVTGNFRPIAGGIQIKNDAGPFAFLGFSAICSVTIGG